MSAAGGRGRVVLVALAALALTLAALALGSGLRGERASAGEMVPPTGNGDDTIDLTSIGTFSAPVHVAFAPGSPDNVYVVEQGGTVAVLESGVEASEPFLDISDRTDGVDERGLLSIAFDPDFQTNGLLYTYSTDAETGDIVIDEFHASSDTDADESSRRLVLRIRHRGAANHNGGHLEFGPDGFLYLATGDGGRFGDLLENAQNRSKLLGKLLRINPHGDEPGEYRSPPGNPFRGRPGRDEIYAVGLRNPFRFSFDFPTGRITIGDVGQDRFEEVDYEGPNTLRGANFGWDRWEGFKRYDRSDDNEASTPRAANHDKPIHVYNHNDRCAIIGGYVSRDNSIASLYGRYVYTDNCDGRLRSLIPKLGGAQNDHPIGTEQVSNPGSFGQDPETGRLYVTSLSGPVYWIKLQE